jgi:hypothetical protein
VTAVDPSVRAACQRKAHAGNRKRRVQDSDGEWRTVQPEPRLGWTDVYGVMTAAAGRCYWCAERVGVDGTLEHLTRVCDGGTNDRVNLAWACLPCNRKGYYREPLERGAL